MNPVVAAFTLALSLALGVGPGLVLQIEAGVNRGFKAGFFLVLGLYLSDIFILFILNLGFSSLVHQQIIMNIIGIFGGFVLCVFGFRLFFKKNKVSVSKNLNNFERAKNLLSFFVKGILVNITNPTIFLFWMTLTALVATHYGFHSLEYWQFFTVLFGTALLFDLIKVYLFSRTHKVLSLGFLNRINKALGLILFCIGLFFVVKTLVLFRGI